LKEDYYQYTNRFFGRWAPFYNLITMPISKIREKVVDMANAEKRSSVLDVCSGTGKQAFAFAKRGYHVVGIDLSPDMLKVAESKNKYENVRFEAADATKLTFDNDSFDVSCISFALHDMPHEIRHKALDEMKRVSRRIVIVDYHIPDNKLERWFHVFLTSLYESRYYKDFAGRDLKELLQQHDLTAVREAYALVDFAKILVCEAAIA
jgi:ubiquinone/menaquinone biosynthesis C-methylase UbiE